MTGILSQIITLTAFGNDFLKNGKIPNDFNSTNTSFQFCNKIDFREIKKTFLFSETKENIIAGSPTQWFRYLKLEGCRFLRLFFENSKDQSFAKDHKLAGLVGGGGVWLIEAVYRKYSKYWSNRWEVTNQSAPDNKIWSVNYGMPVRKQYSNNIQIDNLLIKHRLRQTLEDIAGFAFRQDLQDWHEQFDKAIAVLDSSLPEEHDSYFKDLIPANNYTLTAKQIIFSAASAWVFGGMGSWNDLGFENKEDNDKYDLLSEQLYEVINEAIIAGVNTY